MEQFYSKKDKCWYGILATGWGNNATEAKYDCCDNGTITEKADNVRFVVACLRSEPGFRMKFFTFPSGKTRCQFLQKLKAENVSPVSTGNHPKLKAA